MKILLFQDETLNLNLSGLCQGINGITDDDFHVATGRTRVKLKPGPIRYPVTHKGVSQDLAEEVKNADMALIVTNIGYENNYFYEAKGKVIILSFYAWSQLTVLPSRLRVKPLIPGLTFGGIGGEGSQLDSV